MRNRRVRASGNRALNRAAFEVLERRQLLSGITGIANSFGQPLIFIDGEQTASYDAGSGAFDFTGTGDSYYLAGATPSSPPVVVPISPFALLQIQLNVQTNGNLAGSQPSASFVLVQDNDGSGTIDSGDTVLLQGTVIANSLGYDSGGDVEVQFNATGGTLESYFEDTPGIPDHPIGFSGNVIGLSTFSFANSFSGFTVKGLVGSLPPSPSASPSIPTLTTTPSGTTTVGTGANLTDTATLTGSGIGSTGTINFQLYSPAGTVVDTESVNVSGDGSYSTPVGYAPTTAGLYQWVASYSGDSTATPAYSNFGYEPWTVNQASPAITTTPGATVILGSGSKLTDSASVTGGYNPTGSLVFTLEGPGNTVVDTETVPFSGDGTYSTPAGYLPTAVGTYQWAVSYNGDPNNTPLSIGYGSEPESVSPASPKLVTTAFSPTGLVVGSAIPQDSVVVSGGYNETGSILFTLKSPTGSTTTQTVPITGNGTYNTSNSVPATQVGTYTWTAAYSGDVSNNIANDQGGPAEQITTVKASPKLVTTAFSQTGLVVGSAIPQDSVVVSGGYNETGSILFTLKSPTGSTTTQTVPITGNGTYNTSNTVPASQVGIYTWTAAYSGDPSNNIANDQGGSAEQITTINASPKLMTTASLQNGSVVGSAIPQDSVVVSGGYNDSGSIIFTLKSPTGSTTTQTVPITGNGTYNTSNTVPASQAGTYTWTAYYGGNALNNSASDQGGTAEQVTVSSASPTITTTPSITAATCGSSPALKDSAVLSGGYAETGIILFNLYGPNNTLLDAEVVGVSGNGTYTTPTGYTLPANAAAGTYQWDSGYSGDSNNANAFDVNNANECVTVTAPTGSISGTKYTDVNGNDTSCGIGADDTPLGGVTINLYANGGSSPIATTVTASNGTYKFSNLATGSYRVQEQLPAGWTETYGTAGYSVNLAPGANATGYNFADFQNTSISGTKYKDITGNGFSSDDTPLGGITIALYSGTSTSCARIATTVTASNGTYSFSNLGPGTYFVQEVVPAGSIETGGCAGYTVTSTSGQNVTGDNFDDYMASCSCSNVCSYYYCINNSSTHYSTCSGNVHEGDQVTIWYDQTCSSTVSICSYTAPTCNWVPSLAPQQVIFDQATATCGSGWHSLTITVPMCYFQVDFVCGPVIPQLGGSGSTCQYSPQGRLFDSCNGGTDAQCSGGAQLSGYVYLNANKYSPTPCGTVAGALITLTGTTTSGKSIQLTRVTGSNGYFNFQGLQAGTYTLTETAAPSYVDFLDSVGTNNGSTDGRISSSSQMTNIVLTLSSDGINYDFAELYI